MPEEESQSPFLVLSTQHHGPPPVLRSPVQPSPSYSYLHTASDQGACERGYLLSWEGAWERGYLLSLTTEENGRWKEAVALEPPCPTLSTSMMKENLLIQKIVRWCGLDSSFRVTVNVQVCLPASTSLIISLPLQHPTWKHLHLPSSIMRFIAALCRAHNTTVGSLA